MEKREYRNRDNSILSDMIRQSLKELENEEFILQIPLEKEVPVNFEDMEGQDGYYHQIEKRIAINDAMSERQTMAAMIHELVHAKLHALDPEHLKEYKNNPGSLVGWLSGFLHSYLL